RRRSSRAGARDASWVAPERRDPPRRGQAVTGNGWRRRRAPFAGTRRVGYARRWIAAAGCSRGPTSMTRRCRAGGSVPRVSPGGRARRAAGSARPISPRHSSSAPGPETIATLRARSSLWSRPGPPWVTNLPLPALGAGMVLLGMALAVLGLLTARRLLPLDTLALHHDITGAR